MANETKETNEPAGSKSFNVILPKIADGECLDQLSEELHQLVRVIQRRAKESSKGAKGTLVLTLSIAGDDSGTLDLHYDIKATPPKPKRARTVFWADRDGNVTDKNPRQMELGGLKDVSRKTEVRQAPAEAGVRDV